MFKNFTGRFVLGSTSPRRRDILKMVDLEFVQKSPQFDETELMKRTDLSPENLVKLIAENKVSPFTAFVFQQHLFRLKMWLILKQLTFLSAAIQ